MRLFELAPGETVRSFKLAPGETLRPIRDAETVLAVYYQDILRNEGVDVLISALWGDGHLVWSGNVLEGGPPYYTAEVDPSTAARCFESIEHAGLMVPEKSRVSRLSPDRPFSAILLRHEGREFKLFTLFEPKEVVRPQPHLTGFMGWLSGYTWWDSVQKESRRDLLHRIAWSRIRLILSLAIPKDGAPVEGEMAYPDCRLSWRERPSPGQA